MNLRELIWPMLEIDPNQNQSDDSETVLELCISDENLELAYQLNSKINENEEDRLKSIETKAALLISSISIAISIVVASNTLVLTSEKNAAAVKVSVVISFILSLYAARTVWFAVKALERGKYTILGIDDCNFKGSKSEYQKHIISCLSKIKEKNQHAINTKVDHVTMAQEYFKRAIMTICVYS